MDKIELINKEVISPQSPYIEAQARISKQPWNRHTMTRLTLPDTIIGENTIVCSGAVIYAGTTIGHHCFIADGASIRENVEIGNHTLIGRNVTIENDTIIGDHVMIQTGAHITGNAIIEDYVFIGPEVCTMNDKYMGLKPTTLEGPYICNHTVVGGNATILPGLEIGAHAIIGAGSVVTKHIPPLELWVGNPAHRIKKVI